MAESTYYSIFEAVRRDIIALNLEGIKDKEDYPNNVQISKVYDEQECDIPGVPGVLLLPALPETFNNRDGSNERDVVGYHVGVVFFADDTPLGGIRGTSDSSERVIDDDETRRAVTHCETYRSEIDPRFLWREKVRRRFVNQRLAGVPEVEAVTCLHQSVVVPRPWIIRNLYQSSLVLRFSAREERIYA